MSCQYDYFIVEFKHYTHVTQSNTTCGAATAYPSGALESTTCFNGIHVPRPLVLDSFLYNVLQMVVYHVVLFLLILRLHLFGIFYLILYIQMILLYYRFSKGQFTVETAHIYLSDVLPGSRMLIGQQLPLNNQCIILRFYSTFRLLQQNQQTIFFLISPITKAKYTSSRRLHLKVCS